MKSRKTEPIKRNVHYARNVYIRFGYLKMTTTIYLRTRVTNDGSEKSEITKTLTEIDNHI